MRNLTRYLMISVLTLTTAVTLAISAAAQNALPAAMEASIDSVAVGVLARTGAPSASVAVVRNGAVVYTHAYGKARLDPPVAAAPGMRYSIGLFASVDETGRLATEQARIIFEGLQQGVIDRGLFTDNVNAYFSDQALADFSSSLGPLGPPTEFRLTRQTLRGGMTYRGYQVRCGDQALRVSTFIQPDGKLEQYQVASE